MTRCAALTSTCVLLDKSNSIFIHNNIVPNTNIVALVKVRTALHMCATTCTNTTSIMLGFFSKVPRYWRIPFNTNNPVNLDKCDTLATQNSRTLPYKMLFLTFFLETITTVNYMYVNSTWLTIKAITDLDTKNIHWRPIFSSDV